LSLCQCIVVGSIVVSEMPTTWGKIAGAEIVVATVVSVSIIFNMTAFCTEATDDDVEDKERDARVDDVDQVPGVSASVPAPPGEDMGVEPDVAMVCLSVWSNKSTSLI
jgi:hypothetical protein